MDIVEKMAADIALAMNGGEWKDGKWYSKGHREAWIKAVKPYADEIERLREKYEEAIDDIEEWGAYASEYFQEKWKLKECIEQHRAALKEAE